MKTLLYKAIRSCKHVIIVILLLTYLLQHSGMKGMVVTMAVRFLMGNEAIGLAAVHAGAGFISGYPGTPSTEVLESAVKFSDGGIHIEWSVNEKSAREAAAGASLAGLRTMVTMKQVGLNVASDPLMSLAYIGIKGGMIILVADDPGPISSQTEQDSRRFAQYAKLDVFFVV